MRGGYSYTFKTAQQTVYKVVDDQHKHTVCTLLYLSVGHWSCLAADKAQSECRLGRVRCPVSTVLLSSAVVEQVT